MSITILLAHQISAILVGMFINTDILRMFRVSNTRIGYLVMLLWVGMLHAKDMLAETESA